MSLMTLHLFMRSQYLWRWQRLPLLRNMLEKADLWLVRGKTRINSWAASKGANPHTRSIYEKNYLRYSVFFFRYS
jgi:hypothetical protein